MPEILTEGDRLELQALNEDNLTERCTVTRLSTAPAAGGRIPGGSTTLIPQTVYIDEPCRVAPLFSPHETTVGDQTMAAGSRLVSFARGRDIRARDELLVVFGRVVGGVWTPTGETAQLDVVGLQQPSSFEVGRFVIAKVHGAPA